MRKRVALCAGPILALGLHVSAQAPAEHLAFEVASIKQNTAGPMTITRVDLRDGTERVAFTNVPLRTVVQVAYPGFADVSGPDWVGKAGPNFDVPRFDINAKAEKPGSVDDMRAMLRELLADRFHLVTHTETRQRDIYALRVARADGTLGPRMHRATTDCSALLAAAVDLDARRTACGNIGTNRPPLHLLGMDIGQLRILGGELGRPVVDQTGLTGAFDIDLAWTPLFFADPGFDRRRFTDIDPDGPNIFTALQEQLGLKLVPDKDEQPVLVIDHVERPTEV